MATYAPDVDFVSVAALVAAPVAAANTVAFNNGNFAIAVETRLPNWTHIILAVNTFVDVMAADIERVHAGGGVGNTNALRTRILYGLAVWANTCGKGALHAQKGRGFRFNWTAGDGTARTYTITAVCLRKIAVERAVNSNSVTIYRIAACTLDCFAEWATASAYVPSWFAGHPQNAALVHVPYALRTLANANYGPTVATCASSALIRTGFHTMMMALPAEKRGTYRRNDALEAQIVASPKAPQVLTVAGVNLGNADPAPADI